MYPITQSTAALFAANKRQTIIINFSGIRESIVLTESDIIQGGFALNRYSVSGDVIEVGSAIAGEVRVTLDNSDGRFNNVTFAGGRLFIRVGVADSDESNRISYVPLGYFTIDDAPRKLKTINFTALDDMVLFDRPVDVSLLRFPMTVSNLVSRICTICRVRLSTNVSTLPNGNYLVNKINRTPSTYRQLLMWAGQITGTCAFMDYNGQLVMKWYDGDTGAALTPSTRFSSDIAEDSISITGVNLSNGDNSVLVGTNKYALDISDNGLIANADLSTIAENILNVVDGFTYLPYTAVVVPMPHLYPLDKVSIMKNNSGKAVNTIVTNVTFKLNDNTELEAVGMTEVSKGYASLNPMTGQEAAIIEQLIDTQTGELNNRVQTVLAFNELISNALGLFVTPVEQPNGSIIYYLHNQSELSESSIIFTMTENGIAWTNTGWNDGNPVWSSGVTAAGDALFKFLSAEGIEVGKVGEDYSIEITPRAFKIYYRDMLVTNIEADEMTIPKASFTDYAQCGKVRLVPYGEMGANLIFID